jgi:hypothetical protein
MKFVTEEESDGLVAARYFRQQPNSLKGQILDKGILKRGKCFFVCSKLSIVADCFLCLNRGATIEQAWVTRKEYLSAPTSKAISYCSY